MLSLTDLEYAYFSSQAGVPDGVSIADAERAFLESVLADMAGASLSDLRYAYYVQALEGGGGETPVVTDIDLSTVTVTGGTMTGTLKVSAYSDRWQFDIDATIEQTGLSKVSGSATVTGLDLRSSYVEYGVSSTEQPTNFGSLNYDTAGEINLYLGGPSAGTYHVVKTVILGPGA